MDRPQVHNIFGNKDQLQVTFLYFLTLQLRFLVFSGIKALNGASFLLIPTILGVSSLKLPSQNLFIVILY